MSQIHLIDELLGAAGIRFRKEKRSKFFSLLIDGLEKFDAIALTDYEYYNPLKVSMYGADETGNIRYLMCHAINLAAARIIQQMEYLELLWLRDVSVAVNEIVALSTLPNLRYLILSLEKNANLVLPHIGRMKQLQVLMIEDTVDPVDLSLLKDLPALRSLIIVTGKVQNTRTLEEITSLRNLWLDEIEDLADISRLYQLEKLGFDSKLKTGYGVLTGLSNLRFLQLDEKIPIGFLHQFPKLQGLCIPYDHPTLSPLLDFPQLDTLFLVNAKIEDVSALHDFKNLSFLDMANCQIRDVRSLAGQQTIAYLSLRNTPIELFPESLAMPRLRHLEMEGNSTSKLANATFLGSCTNLEILKLRDYALEDISFLSKLEKLQVLDLANNQIKDISVMEGLSKLNDLDVQSNQIEHLAPLQNHIALQSLVVSDNPLRDAEVLAGLHQLENLALSGTKPKDLSFIKRLRNLFSIDLSNNEIASAQPLVELPQIARINLSQNQLPSVPWEVVHLRSLEQLNLYENPIQSIDRELLGITKDSNVLQSLRDYFRGLERGRVKHDEVKLLMVGNGRVGKTSLVNRLLDDTFDPSQPSTHGIQLRHWQMEHVAPEKLDGQPLKIHIWDFGGQDIYHATHRLFMQTRALFLLVWDKETEAQAYAEDEFGERYENFPLSYWIDYVKALSGGSPVIIVQNKVDSPQDKLQPYGLELRAVYPPPNGIMDYLYVSAQRAAQNGMSGLCESIGLTLGQLESIGRALPAQWVEVRNRLAALEHRFIDYDQYQALCASVGMQGLEHLSLVQFLHQVGAVFYQPGSFGNRLILDQKWAIEAVYAIFDRRGAAYSDLKRAGKEGLTLDLLQQKVWRHFSADEHQILLEFMRSCELCFEFAKDHYYVPQLLPEEKPQGVALRWRQPTTYSLQLTYAFLHRAIIERFIVRAGRLGADEKPEIWKDGIVIYDDTTDTEALVEAFPKEKCIRIQARGQAPLDMLYMIRKEFEALHQDFPVQLSFSADEGQHFVTETDLKAYADAKASMVPAVGGGLVALDAYTVFLGETSRRLPKGALKLAPPQAAGPEQEEIFISYAWGNPSGEAENREAIVDRLCETLGKQPYQIIRDKKDNGYRKLISTFMQRIGRGKLVIVVISDKYLKSPYCMYELLEVYNQGGFYERIFPIVLPDAKLYNFRDRLQYIKYWSDQKKEIAELITAIGLDAFSADAAFQEYDLYYRSVFNSVDKLTKLLADWNALTPELLEENNFDTILAAIDARLQELAVKDSL